MPDSSTARRRRYLNPMPSERVIKAAPSDPAFVGAFVGGPPSLSEEEIARLMQPDEQRLEALIAWSKSKGRTGTDG